MRERKLVVDARRWEVDGNSGVSLQVLADFRSADGVRGTPPAKFTGPAALWDKVAVVPGIYELEYTMSVVAGRPSLGLAGLRFLQPFELPDLGAVAQAESA